MRCCWPFSRASAASCCTRHAIPCCCTAAGAGEDVLLLDHFPQPHELLTLPRLPLELALSSVGLPQPASAAGTDEAATGVKGQAAAAGEVQEAALERDAQAGGQLQQVACGSKC